MLTLTAKFLGQIPKLAFECILWVGLLSQPQRTRKYDLECPSTAFFLNHHCFTQVHELPGTVPLTLGRLTLNTFPWNVADAHTSQACDYA